jgi:glycosyltransferase involved in cell wall biosynthesis
MPNLVSIIIPCYNASSYIKETIGCVLFQTHQNFEILLINDGSTDESSEVIKTIKDDRIHLVEQENQGVSFSRNKGIAMSKGEFIVFLDSDDILHPNFLERRISTLSKSAAIACASNVVLVDEKGNKIEENKKHFAANKPSQILEFNDGIITCPSSYLFKTDFLKKYKITFNKNLQSSADKYFLLEVLKYGDITIIDSSPMYYKSILGDVFSGIILLFDGSIKVGDVVEMPNQEICKINQIFIRTSQLKTLDGKTIIVPNGYLTRESVINWSISDKVTRFHISVGVAYGSDTQLVKEVLYKSALKHPLVEKRRNITIELEDFGDHALRFKVYFWAKQTWEIINIKSDIRLAIDQAFRNNEIKIPFPQRDLHLVSDSRKD